MQLLVKLFSVLLLLYMTVVNNRSNWIGSQEISIFVIQAELFNDQ